MKNHKSTLAMPVALSLLVLLGLLASTGCPAPAEQSSAGGTSAAGAGGAGENESAPEFVLNTLDGTPVRLGEFEGRVVLIDFWATWCAPCREEIPMFNELDELYRDRGLTILAISDEKPEMVREFVEERGVTYTNLVDDGAVTQQYQVLGLPTAFLIDRQGHIVERMTGEKPRKILEKKIVELLDQAPAS